VLLNLGPGDSPYIEGFSPRYEIDESVATHWTSYDASLRLPLLLDGGSHAVVSLRPRAAETAQVQVEFQGQIVDRFACRGGIFETRQGGCRIARRARARPLRDRLARPAAAGAATRLAAPRSGPGASVRLAGASRWRCAALVAGLRVPVAPAPAWSLGTTALLSFAARARDGRGLASRSVAHAPADHGRSRRRCCCSDCRRSCSAARGRSGRATPYALRALAAAPLPRSCCARRGA
jgi:hypothetical protein